MSVSLRCLHNIYKMSLKLLEYSFPSVLQSADNYSDLRKIKNDSPNILNKNGEKESHKTHLPNSQIQRK